MRRRIARFLLRRGTHPRRGRRARLQVAPVGADSAAQVRAPATAAGSAVSRDAR